MKKGYSIAFLFILFCGITFGQKLDTISVYFNLDSDQPITEPSSQYAKYSKAEIPFIKVIRLEAHCDTTSSAEYNFELAKKRIDATRELLKNDSWQLAYTPKIYGEEMASQSKNYISDKYRRVDIILETNRVPSSLILKKQLNEFLADTIAEQKIELKILFVSNENTILDQSLPDVAALKDFLLENPEIDAELHGHSCCSYFVELSANRAEAISNILIAGGVSPERLSFFGHGNTQPKIWPERNEFDKALNRRVEVVLKRKD